MIAIIASDARERLALEGLCAARGWEVCGCETLSAFKRLLDAQRPRVVVTRIRINDGYADDVLALLQSHTLHAKVIVLLPAAAASALEARLVRLGAECMLRDPIRPEVLVEHIAKYRASPPISPKSSSDLIKIGPATLDPLRRGLQNGTRGILLTPREVKLARCLAASAGKVVTYDDLFDEVLGRSFRGDTSNMRVLLRKLCASALSVGLDLREQIEVIPKTGYRYISG